MIIDFKNIRIIDDPDYPDKIELHMLDQDGSIAEGGQFSKDAFYMCILKFFDENF